MAVMKPGERLRCAGCGTEAVVIKPDGPVPHCCGQEMESASAPRLGTEHTRRITVRGDAQFELATAVT